ncbi:MAG: hypothetical protein C0504_07185 [Candidatus Solibacter sp.]|nr:hypothetical protein [Candidatus Solibacter sp.]
MKGERMKDPVAQVVDGQSGDFVRTLHIRGAEPRPRVFSRTGAYTLRAGEPGRGFRTFTGLKPQPLDAPSSLAVRF